jgi:hypothetical protein
MFYIFALFSVFVNNKSEQLGGVAEAPVAKLMAQHSNNLLRLGLLNQSIVDLFCRIITNYAIQAHMFYIFALFSVFVNNKSLYQSLRKFVPGQCRTAWWCG